MISACGVLCSECPAFLGKTNGPQYRQEAAAAWRRIYRLRATPEQMSCGGCLAADDEVFHTCRKCEARLCCRGKGFATCGECPDPACAKLEKAQSVWDSVPALAGRLSASDFDTYAKPYCGHRERLASVRQGHSENR